MNPLVEVLAMSEPGPGCWAFETWRCQRGEQCCTIEPAPLGHWLGEDAYGNERPLTGYPFIAVFLDGTALMVCEDCAVELEGLAADWDMP